MTLTLDQVILHTVMRQLSTSTYTSNFVETEETFCGRTDIFCHIIRSTGRSQPKIEPRI